MGRELLAGQVGPALVEPATTFLVLGLGNILFQDEGLGVRAVERLRAGNNLPAEVEVLDGGTLGLDLLTYFTPGVRMIILDAVRAGLQPGGLIRLEGQAIPAALAQKMSMHQLGLQDLLAASALRGTFPQQVVLWGMQPAQIDWGLELSPPVDHALPSLVQAALGELQSWGVANPALRAGQ
jgi:hydrogenase maturation protease